MVGDHLRHHYTEELKLTSHQHRKIVLKTSIMFPSTKIFGTPKLLQMILEYATARPQDLLIWQRVNKAWQEAIQKSPRIQETLFLTVKACKDVCDDEPAVLNPFMDVFSEHKNEDFWLFPCHAFMGKASCLTASYTGMFITSPAVTELEIIVFQEGCEFDLVHGSVVSKTGITFGQVAECQMEGTDIYLNIPNVVRMKHTSSQ